MSTQNNYNQLIEQAAALLEAILKQSPRLIVVGDTALRNVDQAGTAQMLAKLASMKITKLEE